VKIKQANADQLLAEWAAKDFRGEMEAGEVTARMYAKMIGLDADRARDILAHHVDRDGWTWRHVVVDGRACRAFRPPAKKARAK